MVEKERDKLAAESADANAAAPDASNASEKAAFERDQKMVMDAATKNLQLQNALTAEAKQALADAKQKLDASKPNARDAASKKYDDALAASNYADYSVRTAERLRLKAIGDPQGLAVAAEDKLVDALARVRLEEENNDNLDKALGDLVKASEANLKAWAMAVSDAEARGDERAIKACRPVIAMPASWQRRSSSAALKILDFPGAYRRHCGLGATATAPINSGTGRVGRRRSREETRQCRAVALSSKAHVASKAGANEWVVLQATR